MTTFRVHDASWADAHATNELEAIAAAIETFTADAADPDPFVADTAAERLRAYQDVYNRRLASLRVQAGTATRRDRDRQAWTDLARSVKDRVGIAEVLALRGIQVMWRGREGHSPCPFCGGTDRFVVWTGPPDRAWCRQCHDAHQRMDVIALVQSLIPDCDGFHAAVTWLADYVQISKGGAS